MMAICFALILLLIWLLRPVAALIHEMGHALPALILTKEIVEIQIGKPDEVELGGKELGSQQLETGLPPQKTGRLRWAFSFRSSLQGFTGYDRESLSRKALLGVIAGGPFLSLMACGFGAWLTMDVFEQFLGKLFATTFLCLNLIVLVRSIIPVTLGNDCPSDCLDFWRTWRQVD